MMKFEISRQEGEALEKKWKKDAKINSSRLMFNASLNDLCLYATIGYLQQCPREDFDIPRLSILPTVLKQNLLTKLGLADCIPSETNITWESFGETLNHLLNNISEFTYMFRGEGLPAADMSATKEDEILIRAADKKIYELLAAKCRNSLTVFHHGMEGFEKLIYCRNLKSNPVIMGSLLSLTNLTRLELNRHVFIDEEFVLLGRTLTKLVNLKCNLLNATWPGISEGLKPLTMLEVFEFQLYCSSAFDGCSKGSSYVQDFHHQCLKEFPQLRVVGSLARDCIVGNGYVGRLCHSLGDTTLFGPRARSQLEELVLRKSITQNQAEWHSNVTMLRITWDSSKFKDYETLLNFKNIKTLIFEYQAGEMPPSIVMRFLQVYGQKLKKFSLFAKNVLTVDEILRFCPNLTDLNLIFEPITRISPHFDGFGKPSLQQLGSITLLFLDCLDASFRPDVLSQLFICSNLEYLVLRELLIDGPSLTKALHMLRMEKVIAPRLISLDVSPLAKYIEAPFEDDKVDLRYQWRLFLWFVCSNAPLLKNFRDRSDIKIGLNFDDIEREINLRMIF